MANRLGSNDPIYDLSRIGGGLNPLPGSPPDASLDATAVGYGSDTNTLTGDVSNFSYNDTTKLLSVKINEAWIQETNYLIVDAGGRGDFTTIQAAINYMDGIAGGGPWTVLIRNGVYTERLNLAPGGTNTYQVTFIGLGNVIIQEDATAYVIVTDAYATPIEFRNITIRHIGISTVWELMYLGNGNAIVFRDCQFSILSQNFAAGNFTVNFHHCSLTGVGRLIYTGTITAVYYNCVFSSTPTLGQSIVYAGNGSTLYLFHCRVINGGAGYDLEVLGSGSISVGRCTYDTDNTNGAITIIDGDVPAPDAGSITPAMLANASAQYKYLVSGATPFAYAESAGALNIVSGKTLTVPNSQNIGAYAITAVNLTLDSTHHWVKVTAACTITLPAASGITGWEYIITATANSVIVDGNGSETISGALTVTLNAGDSLQITSDGANWFII